MKNMHFQGTRCSWCFQGPVLVQLCVASSKVACVAWVAVSVSDASGRSGASKKRPRKQASINESSCEWIRKNTNLQITKKTDLSPYSPTSVQRRITLLSVKRLALRRFQSRQHRTATSTRWWHLPAAKHRDIIGWQSSESVPRAWGAARAARLFIMPRDPPSAKSGVDNHKDDVNQQGPGRLNCLN